MNTFEAVAAAFGILSVFLSTRQNVWSWPTSLVNVTMYGIYFSQQKLFALMVLQGFFALISLYGWYEWLFGGERRTPLTVSRVTGRLALILIVVTAALTLVLEFVLRNYTEDPAPLVDALLSSVSLVAQWMMARKLLECWVIWVGVNLISVPFFLARAEYPTAIQYGVFLALAVSGWVQWRASLAGRHVAQS
jgi:nicotinamide mononucleotide transporter